jgi:CRP-like cAMP-binding protein
MAAMQQALRSIEYGAIAPASNRRLLERVISALPVVRSVSRGDLAELAAHAALVEARRGETVARRGERTPGVIALVSGSAKVALRRTNGEEKVLRLLSPGDACGLAAAALDQPCPADVVMLAPSTIAIVPPLPLQRLLQSDAGFARAMSLALAERLLELVAELESSVQQSGLERLACYLGSLVAAEACARVRLPATKTTIAARLGVKKETLSRMLRDLVDRGLIAVSGLEVEILDHGALSRLAGAPPRSDRALAP